MLSAADPAADPASDAARAEAPVERVRLRLLNAVAAHRLPPGAKLTEEEIAQVFGVSRTVVRAALQALAHDGVVAIARNRGAFVASPDPREAREVFEARALLEPRTAFSAAGRATAADVAALRAHLDAEQAALASGDAGRAVYLSGRFHVLIAGIAAQETIAAFIGALVARSSLIVALYWRRRDALCERCAHGALAGALARGDAPEAEALMRSHLADLMSGLDLTPRARPATDLASALSAAP